jgi:2-polyprenyl-3-methyl-5-hydroxy-6-metoxy-1,4-benzoquinol methylase
MKSTKSTWDAIYETGTDWGNSQPTDFIARAISRGVPNAKALDLGCGSGRNSIYLARLGYHVTCVDASSLALARLAQAALLADVQDRVVAVCADITHFHITEQYDLVICYGVINSIESSEWPRLVRKIQTATVEDGINVLAYFNEFSSPASVDGKEVLSLVAGNLILAQYQDWTQLEYDCRTNSHSHGIREVHTHVTERMALRNTRLLQGASHSPLTVAVIGPTNFENSRLSIHLNPDALQRSAVAIGRAIAASGNRLACIPDDGVGRHAFNSYNECNPKQLAKIFAPREDPKVSKRVGQAWLSQLKHGAETISDITWEQQAPTMLQHSDIVIAVGLSSGTLIEILWTKWIKRPVYISLDLSSPLPAEVRSELSVFELPTFGDLLALLDARIGTSRNSARREA